MQNIFNRTHTSGYSHLYSWVHVKIIRNGIASAKEFTLFFVMRTPAALWIPFSSAKTQPPECLLREKGPWEQIIAIRALSGHHPTTGGSHGSQYNIGFLSYVQSFPPLHRDTNHRLRQIEMPRAALCTQWVAVIPKSLSGVVNVPKCLVLVSPGPDGTGGST